MNDLMSKVLDAPIVQETIIPSTVGVVGAGMSWIAINERVSSVIFTITGIASAVVIIYTALNMVYKYKLTKLNYEKALREAQSTEE